MFQDHEAELRVARAEGIVATDEAEALRTEAVEQRRPLDLLRERGRISDETLTSLRRMAGGGDADATASVAPPTVRDKDYSDAPLGPTPRTPPPDSAAGVAVESGTEPDVAAAVDPDATATLNPARAARPRGVRSSRVQPGIATNRFTGKASVPGENALEVLSNIATAEPIAPRDRSRHPRRSRGDRARHLERSPFSASFAKRPSGR